MRRVLAGLAAAAVAALWAAPARAQDSVFGIRGLGFPDLGLSARSEAMGTGNALFDAEASLNPAAIAAWTTTAGWAVASSSSRRFDPGSGTVSLNSTRFPMFGFAAPVSPRITVAVTAADYLDRNWNVTQVDTVTPRDSAISVTDATRSQGGVSDLGFSAAWHRTGFAVGLGLHILTGSAQTTVLRTFSGDTLAYLPFSLQSTTSYRGVGVSLGVVAAPIPAVALAASLRTSGRLRAESPDTSVDVPMPLELDGGVSVQPMPGLVLAATAGWASWSRASAALVAAGQGGARNVSNVGAGAEVSLVHLGRRTIPLRVGFHWRQLPFPVPEAAGASWPSEQAGTFGFGFVAAGGRATVDIGFEFGSRVAGAIKESYTTAQLGLTVRP